MSRDRHPFSLVSGALALVGLGLTLVPPLALVLTLDGDDLSAAMAHDLYPALRLSAETGAVAVAVVALSGVPLAYWISRRTDWLGALANAAVSLPLITPPAVAGVALLVAFGPDGLALDRRFVASTFGAIVLAQSFVAMPFLVRPLIDAFRAADEELAFVARSLGAGPARTFFRVVLPQVRPALFASLAVAFCRAFGELSATLLFAGTLDPGTNTLPLVMRSTLGEDVGAARMMALFLLTGSVALSLVLQRVGRRP